ncbi:MAG: DinB family protein [Chloroflexi bacterium]|nr:DinB family protein [Chloroflexota bacterium]
MAASSSRVPDVPDPDGARASEAAAGAAAGAGDRTGSVALFYADWRRYNDRIVDGLRGRPAADLELTAGPDQWPVWGLAAHAAGARVYWLCAYLGEPGAATTPFTDPTGYGWEDDLATPRGADELVWALESSWAVIESCLTRWTPAMLDEPVERDRGGKIRVHTRQSILLRLITHDAFHAGEIALLFGMHGRPPLDLWPPAVPAAPAVNEA